MTLLENFQRETIEYPEHFAGSTSRTIDVYFTLSEFERFSKMARDIRGIPAARSEYATRDLMDFGLIVTAKRSSKELLELSLTRDSCLIEAHGDYDDSGNWIAKTDNGSVKVDDLVNEALGKYNLVYLMICNESGKELSLKRKGEVVYAQNIFDPLRGNEVKHIVYK